MEPLSAEEAPSVAKSLADSIDPGKATRGEEGMGSASTSDTVEHNSEGREDVGFPASFATEHAVLSSSSSTPSTSSNAATGSDTPQFSSASRRPSPLRSGTQDELDNQSDQRAKVRFAGAVRRGGWRNVNSVATSRDHSDQSSEEESKITGKGRASQSKLTEPRDGAASPLRPGKLIARGSSEAVRRAEKAANSTSRRSSSKSLGDEDSDDAVKEDATTSSIDNLVTRGLIGIQAGPSRPMQDRRGPLSPPAVLPDLPAFEGQPSEAYAGQIFAPSAPEIDWANFVYAYARGKWDPMRPPRPPGKSNVFPGSSTRVVLAGPADGESDLGYSSPSSSVGSRRPSLGYDDLSISMTNIEGGKSEHPRSPKTASSQRRPSALELTPLDDSSAKVGQNSRSNGAAVDPLSPRRGETFAAPATQGVQLDPVIFRECRPTQAPPSLHYDKTSAGESNRASSTQTEGNAKKEVDEAAILRLASWSTPELHTAVAKGSKAQEDLNEALNQQRPAQKVQRSTHSTSEAIGGPSLLRKEAQHPDLFAPDASVWHPAVAQIRKSESVPPTVAPSSPALRGSHPARARSPSPDASGLPEKPMPRRVQSITAGSSSPGSSAETLQRPGPTPVQLGDLPDIEEQQATPGVWQSAPEGFLAGWRLGGLEINETLNDQNPSKTAWPEEGNTVAGLRRAARRSSLLRPEEPTSRSKPISIHSHSWASEPGYTTSTASQSSIVSSSACCPLPNLPDSASQKGENGASLLTSALPPDAGPSRSPLVPAPVAESVDKASTSQTDAQGVEAAPGASDSNVYKDIPLSEVDGSSFLCIAAKAQAQENPTSSMAQTLSPHRHPPPLHRSNPSNNYLVAGKQAEQFYTQSGYLPALNPPDEAQRRTALARYGPPKITGDPNFDRIGHLVRLVFDSKIVLISLVGADEQVFQTAVGGGAEYSQVTLQTIAGSRHCSFCAHAILQPNDEPLVILDASKDWRFAGNPLVIGEPFIRFYAGCPLRTNDGHNLGTLCLIDVEPRASFSPRLRHTLKEFARVVMRELELTRDRIHLTIRDRMQRSIELFTRDCLEMAAEAESPGTSSNSSDAAAKTDSSNSVNTNSSSASGLQALYAFAAKNMHDALRVAGAVVFDLSHFELIESPGTTDEDGLPSNSKIFYPSPYSAPDVTPYASFDNPSKIQTINSSPDMPDEGIKSKAVPPMAILGASERLPVPEDRGKPVPLSHHIKIAQFLRNHRTGYYYPLVPSIFRPLLPAGTSNMLLVPIFGLNKQPFALLCAYATPQADGPLLEDVRDSALQYMRSMGTIILSAVLKKDLMLADQAKSHFISNISHELRTPLHGILASAELLAETKLNTTQGSYLDTVEACGKSLLELVNHVLDFTKLSGSAMTKSNASHTLSACDLVKLVQEVCESSWIGQTARKLDSQQSAGIGSAYAIGAGSQESSGKTQTSMAKQIKAGDVETVIDVSMRKSGWLVSCDSGGIRRVLMNLIGNSLKFTTAGFVHVSLREIQSNATHVVVELSVTDTGRGISKAFLEQQLFHPFTQENELGPGTGLGLSIVNSIVQSPSINGKIDVWSTLGEGTEMRITCEMALASSDEIDGAVYQPALDVRGKRTVSLAGFNDSRGQVDFKQVLLNYLEHWWHFVPSQDDGREAEGFDGDIVIINEDVGLFDTLRKRRQKLPPVILLSSALGDSAIPEACEAYHEAGGIARMLFKPTGPAKLEGVVDFCLQCLDRAEDGDPPERDQTAPSTPLPSPRPSPMHHPAMEQSDSYFDRPVSTNATGKAESTAPSAEIVQASSGLTWPEEGSSDLTEDLVTPKGYSDSRDTPQVLSTVAEMLPMRRPSALSKGSHHISPSLWESTPAALLRRHSDEDEVLRHRGRESAMDKQLGRKVHKAEAIAAAIVSGANTSPKAGSRPLLPPRSITFHQEPQLHKHMALSPSLLREVATAGGADYFSAKEVESSDKAESSRVGTAEPVQRSAANSDESVLSDRKTTSPAVKPKLSPGSTVRIEGTDDLLLRSALGTVKNDGSSLTTKKQSAERRIRVMGVDDNQINIKILAAYFAKFDVDFVPARNGQECVDLFEQGHGSSSDPSSSPSGFDIIILDISMPILDGYQATAALRRKEVERAKAAGKSIKEIPRVKILCLTGRNSEEDKRKAFASGADGFLTRPLSLRSLASLMRLLTQRGGGVGATGGAGGTGGVGGAGTGSGYRSGSEESRNTSG